MSSTKDGRAVVDMLLLRKERSAGVQGCVGKLLEILINNVVTWQWPVATNRE